MDPKIKKTYEQLNLVSFISMFMILNIHFFSNFAKYVDNEIAIQLVYIIRSFSIVAVPLYLIISGYTNIYLEKKVNFYKIFLYIVVPTILFQQLNHYMFDWRAGGWTLDEGFIGSWFGDLYLGLMLLLPWMMALRKKNKKISYIVFAALYIVGYALSIKFHSPNLNLFGIWVFIPYIGLIFLTTDLTFKTKQIPRIWLVITILASIAILTPFFNPTLMGDTNVTIARSYFSPVVLIYAIAFIKFAMTLDINLSWVRKISRSSYFFYFSHYIMIHIFMFWYPNFIASNTLTAYLIAVLGAYILGYVLYEIYNYMLKQFKLI